MYINIPVQESYFKLTVRHISSLTSFVAELVVYFSEKGKPILFSSLLVTGKYDRHVSNEFGTNLRPFDVRI